MILTYQRRLSVYYLQIGLYTELFNHWLGFLKPLKEDNMSNSLNIYDCSSESGKEFNEAIIQLINDPSMSKFLIVLWVIINICNISCILSLRYLPFFSGFVESIGYHSSMIICVLNLFISSVIFKLHTPYRFLYGLLGYSIIFTLFFSFASVFDTRELLILKCNGIVEKKYISGNHQRGRIVVNGTVPEILEGVSKVLWKSTNLGDIIIKDSKSPFVFLNGKKILIIDIKEYESRKCKQLRENLTENEKKQFDQVLW